MIIQPSSHLLFPGRDWDIDTLYRINDAITPIAIGEMGLDIYPNSFQVIGSKGMLANYAMVGMHLYDHWSEGLLSLINKQRYKNGMGLAFEMVINANPCISYLMEENSATMQTLVIAHAAYGHNHFFKNNYKFRDLTDAASIMPYLAYARSYIKDCEEKYGEEAVETLLDAAHALRPQSVHDVGKRQTDLKTEELKRAERMRQAQLDYNDLWGHTVPTMKKSERALLEEKRRDLLQLPQENILYFLEKHAPKLKTWQKEILRIVRKIAQYFYPQEQTKVMNEGCATYVHYKIMTRLLEKGQLSESNFLEFLMSHVNVVFQVDFDDPRFDPRERMNPYALGFGIMRDIERIVSGIEPLTGAPCTQKQREEDKEWFPDIAGKGDVMGVLRDAWANYRDDSFIVQYLSPRLIREKKMFLLENDLSRKEGILVKAIHNERGYREVRKSLADVYDDGQTRPDIKIVDVDLLGSRQLKLVHTIYQGTLLEPENLSRVIQYLADLWGYEVVLCEVDANGTVVKEHKASPR